MANSDGFGPLLECADVIAKCLRLNRLTLQSSWERPEIHTISRIDGLHACCGADDCTVDAGQLGFLQNHVQLRSQGCRHVQMRGLASFQRNTR